MKTIRWGIISTGNIASQFAQACNFENRRTGRSRLTAVASREKAKADEFAYKWKIPHSFGSYQELFSDPEIDAVYIATPHNSHVILSLAALDAGKAVLCEKPVSLTGAEIRPVIDLANKKNLFFMEAMWMKFNPCFRKTLSWLHEGKIGNVKYISADFFLDVPFDPKSRWYDPALGGGALLDLGIYPVTFAAMMAGRQSPDRISSIIRKSATGVDAYNTAHLFWKNGVIAAVSSSISFQGLGECRTGLVIGDAGSIVLPHFFMAQNAVLLDAQGNARESFDMPFDCNGYEYEIREVESCLIEGKSESSVQTWADSIMVMDILDEIRMEAKDE